MRRSNQVWMAALLLVGSLMGLPAHASTAWGPAQTLPGGSSTASVDTRLLVSADGQKMISVWVRRTSATTGVVLGARSTDAGASWTPTAAITDSDKDIYSAQIVGNSDLTKVTVAWGVKQNPTLATLSTRISMDLGNSWTSMGTVTTGMKPFDFALAASSSGTIVHALWIASVPPPAPSDRQVIKTSVSSNAGGNWTSPKTLSSTSGVAAAPALTTSTDGSRATALWSNTTVAPARIDASYTSDTGSNWSSPQTINTPTSLTFPAGLASSGNGTAVAAAWGQWDADTKRIIRVATSANGGATWTAVRSLSPDGVDANSPGIFSSSASGRLAVAWGDATGAYVRVRPGSASDWNPIITLGGRADQITVSGSQDGNNLAVIWRSLPDYSLKAATSGDGGLTWTTKSLPAVPEARNPKVAFSADGQVLAAAWGALNSGQWLTQAAVGPRLTPDMAIAPASLDFGAVPKGVTADLGVTLTNSGLSALFVNGLVSSNDRFFVVGNTCSTPVAAGGTCTITVRFAPNTAGTSTGSLVLSDNTPAGSHTLEVRGVGTDPVISPKQAQKPRDAAGIPPKRIKGKGRTVLVGANPLTNAGQLIQTSVKVKAPKRAYRVLRRAQGKVIIRTFGKKLSRVTVVQNAPETADFQPYSLTTTYRKNKRA